MIFSDFQLLFASFDLSRESLKVVTLCQKTENDMVSWTEQGEEERTQIAEQVIFNS